MVDQHAAGENVGGGEIHLEAAEGVEGGAAGAVLAAGQTRDEIDVVIEVDAVVEPGAAGHDRSGNLQPRGEVIDVPAVGAGDTRNEVGAAEAPAIVAHLGLDVERPRRALSLFRGVAAAVEIKLEHSFDVEACFQAAGGGIGDVEAVEQEIGLLRIAAVDVDAAGGIEHDTVHHGQRIAQILRGRIRNSQN